MSAALALLGFVVGSFFASADTWENVKGRNDNRTTNKERAC
jgi:hypothetical protein